MSQPSDLDGNAYADPVDGVDERVHRSDRAHASAGPSGGEDRSRPASDVDQGSRRPGTRDAESARAAASPTGASARPPHKCKEIEMPDKVHSQLQYQKIKALRICQKVKVCGK